MCSRCSPLGIFCSVRTWASVLATVHTSGGGERTNCLFAFWCALFPKSSPRILCTESEWECPAFQPVKASVGHVCFCPLLAISSARGQVSSHACTAQAPPPFPAGGRVTEVLLEWPACVSGLRRYPALNPLSSSGLATWS